MIDKKGIILIVILFLAIPAMGPLYAEFLLWKQGDPFDVGEVLDEADYPPLYKSEEEFPGDYLARYKAASAAINEGRCEEGLSNLQPLIEAEYPKALMKEAGNYLKGRCVSKDIVHGIEKLEALDNLNYPAATELLSLVLSNNNYNVKNLDTALRYAHKAHRIGIDGAKMTLAIIFATLREDRDIEEYHFHYICWIVSAYNENDPDAVDFVRKHLPEGELKKYKGFLNEIGTWGECQYSPQ